MRVGRPAASALCGVALATPLAMTRSFASAEQPRAAVDYKSIKGFVKEIIVEGTGPKPTVGQQCEGAAHA